MGSTITTSVGVVIAQQQHLELDDTPSNEQQQWPEYIRRNVETGRITVRRARILMDRYTAAIEANTSAALVDARYGAYTYIRSELLTIGMLIWDKGGPRAITRTFTHDGYTHVALDNDATFSVRIGQAVRAYRPTVEELAR